MAQPAIDPTALAAAKDGDTPATSALITALRRQVESEARAREQQQAKQLALPGPPGQQQQKKKEEPEEESSSSEDEELPPDPQNCTVSGPGFTGAAACQPVKLFVYVKDAQHRQMREGGEEVVVRVQPSSRSMGDTFMASVEDNNNGIYTATYTAPAKGNYMVSVEVNGLPISGSPFPVFFSAPVDPAVLAQQEEEAKAAAAAAAPPPQGVHACMCRCQHTHVCRGRAGRQAPNMWCLRV
uniref:YtkA-like domain-containing protein n=1 Tax=Dunaliella tertiolecta TaxID=3047 RepID=A0A7S3R2H4_DUNTE